MPTIDIDGRGSTPEEAVRDMWSRIIPLEEKGYHAVSSVEIVDTKTRKILESFELTDPDWSYTKPGGSSSSSKGGKQQPQQRPNRPEEHKPPRPHENAFEARIKLEY